MRRVIASVYRYFAESGRLTVRSWNTFWFTPADPTPLGFIRILTGIMLVYTHAVWGLELEAFFGPNGWLPAEAVHALQSDQTVFSYWWWVPTNWMWFAHGVALAVLVLFTIGCCTRITSVLAFIITISYANRVPAALFGLDQINAMLTLYLAIGPSGAALSVDRLLARFRLTRQSLHADAQQPRFELLPSPSANLATRLIQVHMCVIYLFAGVSKLQGTAWWSGEAMWLTFANLEYQSRDMTWLAHYPWLLHLMTHVTIVWEISFCALIWRPQWRPLMLFIGVLLHVGIGACLGMWTFALIMLVGCSSFLPPSLFREIVIALGGARRLSTIRFDGSPRVERTASWLKAIDVADRLALVDYRRPEADSVSDATQPPTVTGRLEWTTESEAGVVAPTRLTAVLPILLWPLASIGYLIGAVPPRWRPSRHFKHQHRAVG